MPQGVVVVNFTRGWWTPEKKAETVGATNRATQRSRLSVVIDLIVYWYKARWKNDAITHSPWASRVLSFRVV